MREHVIGVIGAIIYEVLRQLSLRCVKYYFDFIHPEHIALKGQWTQVDPATKRVVGRATISVFGRKVKIHLIRTKSASGRDISRTFHYTEN